MRILHLDFECRSIVNVKDVGPVEYARHPSTEVTAIAWSVQDGDDYTPVETWYPGKSPNRVFPPQPLRGDFIVAAHNSGFERAVWNENLAPRHGWDRQPLSRFQCSSARAAMLGLPPSLDGVAEALRLPVQKDKEGHALMLRMTTPKNVIEDPNLFGEVGPVYIDDPASMRRQAEYCAVDVEVEIEADKRMGPLTPAEREIWLMDQEINQRGIAIDRDLCRRTLDIITATLKQRGADIGELTGGNATKVTQGKRLIKWLKWRGVKLPDSLSADIVAQLLEGELPADVREVLEIRRDSAKSSTAKYVRMLQRSESDGRMRDNLRYHGAFTGRWAGQGAQIQNYPRGSIEYMELLAECFLDESVELIELMFGDVVDAAKSLLRGCLVASEDRSLLVWDYGQIEARVLPWLAGESHKVKAFYDLDAGKGVDIYKLGYASSFVVDPLKVTKTQRQVGKVCELALGYGGGPGAFVSMAKIYRVEISDYLPELRAKFPDVAAKASKAYDQRGRGSGIPKATWIAAEIVKTNWRAKHPKTVKFWYDLERAAIECVETGRRTRAGKIRFQMHDEFLKMILPSNRPISYFRPSVGVGRFGGKSLNYWQYKEGRFQKIDTYGGKLAENATQGTARDPMTDGMLRLRYAGYPIVGTVHDEVVAEEKDAVAESRLAEGKKLLETAAPWAKGLPLVVEGFVTKRYKK